MGRRARNACAAVLGRIILEQEAIGAEQMTDCGSASSSDLRLIELLIEIGALRDADTQISILEATDGANTDLVVEAKRLRGLLAVGQASEAKNGPYSAFNFDHPAVVAIRAAGDVAMIKRSGLWNGFKDGWLTFSFMGVDPGYVSNERDYSAREMVVEGVLTHASDGVPRPARLRLPDGDAHLLAMLMGDQYGLDWSPRDTVEPVLESI